MNEKTDKRKVYIKPAANKLTPAEAERKLVPLAAQGDEGAQELLDLIFISSPSEASNAGKS